VGERRSIGRHRNGGLQSFTGGGLHSLARVHYFPRRDSCAPLASRIPRSGPHLVACSAIGSIALSHVRAGPHRAAGHVVARKLRSRRPRRLSRVLPSGNNSLQNFAPLSVASFAPYLAERISVLSLIAYMCQLLCRYLRVEGVIVVAVKGHGQGRHPRTELRTRARTARRPPRLRSSA
jgi:hypothetical protein